MTASLIESVQGHALVLTLSNPGMRNALGPAIYEPMRDALAKAGQRRGVRAVVLTGADGVFSAGGDLKRLRENRTRPREVQEASLEALGGVVRALVSCSVPVIAAVEGAAAGAGLSLVLGCDLVVAARSAKFAMSHVRVGLSPDGGGTWFAARRLPWQACAEMLFEAQTWPAERLQALGVVNEIVDDGQALPAALARVERLERISPHALMRTRRLMLEALSTPLERQLEAEKTSFADCLFHADAGEAIDAFLEKRAPKFGEGAA